MCGIAFSLGPSNSEVESIWPGLIAANAARGPDSQCTHTLSEGFSYLRFFSSVLHLRGPRPVAQPVLSPLEEDGDVLCWNGQVFEGLIIGTDESDTTKVWELLRREGESDSGVREAMGRIEGPWACLYYRASSRTLYISRDPLGRRSLLISTALDGGASLVIASVVPREAQNWSWADVSCEDILALDLGRWSEDGLAAMRRIPRISASDRPFAAIPPINCVLPPPSYLSSGHPSIHNPALVIAADDFISALESAVRVRVANIPPLEGKSEGRARLAVLFSGGIDCTVLALLCDRSIPSDEPIDLLNVAFENPRSLGAAARQAAAVSGKKNKGKGRAEARLAAAGEDPAPAVDDEYEDDESKRGRIYSVPDRLTGREAVEELRQLCPTRTWNFVEIDVPYEVRLRLRECQQHRGHVASLIHPADTVMDLSLALALYFASRGVGSLPPSPSSPARRPHTSCAKVLISGLGADEQLGGYSRHRRAYEHAGFPELIDEIQLDLTRLPTRNLARDDRVMTSHAKEARFPYLSLSLIAYLSALPLQLKMDFRRGEHERVPDGGGEDGGEVRGDKALLRIAARRLGLFQAAGRKKTAMQFGARSARMELEGPAEGDEGEEGGQRTKGKGVGARKLKRAGEAET